MNLEFSDSDFDSEPEPEPAVTEKEKKTGGISTLTMVAYNTGFPHT